MPLYKDDSDDEHGETDDERQADDNDDRQFCQQNSKLAHCAIQRNKLCGRPPQYAHAPCTLTFDLLTLKVVPESRVT